MTHISKHNLLLSTTKELCSKPSLTQVSYLLFKLLNKRFGLVLSHFQSRILDINNALKEKKRMVEGKKTTTTKLHTR